MAGTKPVDGSGGDRPSAADVAKGLLRVEFDAVNSSNYKLLVNKDGTTTGWEEYYSPGVYRNAYVQNSHSLKFDDSGVVVLNALAHPNELTYSIWVRPTANSAGFNAGYLFATEESGLAMSESTQKHHNIASREVYVFDGDAKFFSPAVYVTDDTWQHLVVTFTERGDGGTLTATCYLDGVLAGVNSAIDDAKFVQTKYVGRWGNLHPTKAYVDQIAIWAHALDADQISAIYNSGSGRDVGGFRPLLLYDCDEGSGSTLINRGRTGSAYDGTVTGSGVAWNTSVFSPTLTLV